MVEKSALGSQDSVPLMASKLCPTVTSTKRLGEAIWARALLPPIASSTGKPMVTPPAPRSTARLLMENFFITPPPCPTEPDQALV